MTFNHCSNLGEEDELFRSMVKLCDSAWGNVRDYII